MFTNFFYSDLLLISVIWCVNIKAETDLEVQDIYLYRMWKETEAEILCDEVFHIRQ